MMKKRTLSTVWKQSQTIFVQLKILRILVDQSVDLDVAMFRVDLKVSKIVKKKPHHLLNAFDATNLDILQMNAR
jgi:hypothetical protein